jgi:hypothetical protein
MDTVLEGTGADCVVESSLNNGPVSLDYRVKEEYGRNMDWGRV